MDLDLSDRRIARITKMIDVGMDWGGGTGEWIREEYLHQNNLDEDDKFSERNFKKWFARWARDRIYDAVAELENTAEDEEMKIWRMITAPVGWKPDAQNLGIYWSWDKRAAEAHWGHFGDGQRKWRIGSIAQKNQIDRDTTISLNASPEWVEEKEIRLKDGVLIPILSLEVDDTDAEMPEYIGRKIAANPARGRQ